MRRPVATSEGSWLQTVYSLGSRLSIASREDGWKVRWRVAVCVTGRGGSLFLSVLLQHAPATGRRPHAQR